MCASQYETRCEVTERIFKLTIAAIWAMSFFSYTMPGRTIAKFLVDPIALFKLAVCGGMISLTGYLVSLIWTRGYVKKTLRRLSPFAFFYAWAVMSVAWSPNKVVSVSQLISLLTVFCLLLSVVLVGTSHERRMRLFIHLSLAVLVANLLLFSVQALAPAVSGLDRTKHPLGADGIIHPTAAGANAALGLLLFAGGAFICRNRRLIIMFVPAAAITMMVIVFAASRTALGMVVATLPIAMFAGVRRHEMGRLLIAGSLIGVACMFVDPSFSWTEGVNAKTEEIARRGESARQLATLNGRSEMWAAVWKEYNKSVLIGHGYFITSERGEFFMWDRILNHTAHNLVLQMLVSTGVVGTALLMWALFIAIWPSFAVLKNDDRPTRQLRTAIHVVFFWFLGWAQLCISFMGPLRTESVVFFVLLGLLVATDLNDEPTFEFDATESAS